MAMKVILKRLFEIKSVRTTLFEVSDGNEGCGVVWGEDWGFRSWGGLKLLSYKVVSCEFIYFNYLIKYKCDKNKPC